jgi:hypothetical protein
VWLERTATRAVANIKVFFIGRTLYKRLKCAEPDWLPRLVRSSHRQATEWLIQFYLNHDCLYKRFVMVNTWLNSGGIGQAR